MIPALKEPPTVVEEMDPEGGRDSFLEGSIQRGGSGPLDQNPDLMVEGAVRVGRVWGTFLGKRTAWPSSGGMRDYVRGLESGLGMGPSGRLTFSETR